MPKTVTRLKSVPLCWLDWSSKATIYAKGKCTLPSKPTPRTTSRTTNNIANFAVCFIIPKPLALLMGVASVTCPSKNATFGSRRNAKPKPTAKPHRHHRHRQPRLRHQQQQHCSPKYKTSVPSYRHSIMPGSFAKLANAMTTVASMLAHSTAAAVFYLPTGNHDSQLKITGLHKSNFTGLHTATIHVTTRASIYTPPRTNHYLCHMPQHSLVTSMHPHRATYNWT